MSKTLAEQTIVYKAAIADHLTADIYEDGTLEISISDDLLVSAQLGDGVTDAQVRNAMPFVLAKIAKHIPLERIR